MSDKTVPADADDYKKNDRTPESEGRQVENDPQTGHSGNDEITIPNRDKDEFSKDHLKKPEVDIGTEEEINEKSDER